MTAKLVLPQDEDVPMITTKDEGVAESRAKPIALKSNEQLRDDLKFSEDAVVIAVMGGTGAGKSTFISLLTDEDVGIGHNLQSCIVPRQSIPFSVTYYDAGTTNVGLYKFNYKGHTVYILDTPGFDDTNRPDSETLQEIALYLAGLYSMKTRLAGLIYLHRITDTRVSGSSLKNIRIFQNLCGADAFDRVVLATTMWSTLDSMEGGREIGVQRSKELGHPEFWGQMIQKKSIMKEHDGSKDSALSIISELVDREGGAVLQIQSQMVDKNLSLENTDAGRYLQKDLIEARERYEKEITELKKNLEQAKAEEDAEAIDIFKQEKEAAESRVEILRNNSNQLKLSLSQVATREQANLISRVSGPKDSLAPVSDPQSEERLKAVEEQYLQVVKELQESKTQTSNTAQHVAELEKKHQMLEEQLAQASKKKKQQKSPANGSILVQVVNWAINLGR
ncbi:hypothetical protein ACHAQJ_006582 [Trichoderma viride]